MSEQDKGASSGEDRAAAAEPVVSALRDGIPSAHDIVTQRDRIREAPKIFREQYGSSLTTPAYWKKGQTRGDVVNALDSLDLDACSVSDIDQAIGVQGWAENECDICGNTNADLIVRFGDEPDYEARWIDFCLPCLSQVGKVVAQALENPPEEDR